MSEKRTLVWRVTVDDIHEYHGRHLGTREVVAKDAAEAIRKALNSGHFCGSDGLGYVYEPIVTKLALISKAS